MRVLSRVACVTVLTAVAVPAFAQYQYNKQYVYIRSNFDQPWGQTTNEDAMDTIFGSGYWTTMYYETANPAQLFSGNTAFVFMEGGDSSFTVFADFIANNFQQISTWVSSGGRLLIMSAPNDPLQGATVALPDNVTLHSDAFYESAASSAYAIDTTNTIFSSPYQAAYNFSGNFFAHGYFTGTDLNALMQSDLNEVVLGQDVIGSGLMVVGGMTTDNFQLPQPAAHALLENIIYYSALRPL